MPTYRELIQSSQIERFDAQVLLLHIVQKNRAWLITHDTDIASDEHTAMFESLAARRRAGEPIAYILGVREFYGRDFTVTPAVLIPRPDTELIVELALARAPHAARVIDLGTGSGCIPITLKLERPDLSVAALDISLDALAVATHNAAALQADIRFMQSDWLNAVVGEEFDLIVSNPPYIEVNDIHLSQGDLRFEPSGALTDGGNGLQHLSCIISQAKHHLIAGAWLLLEHGWDQGAACREILQTAGYTEVQTWRDLGDNDRVSGGIWRGA
jgi:release factor glutamine methyltransferase